MNLGRQGQREAAVPAFLVDIFACFGFWIGGVGVWTPGDHGHAVGLGATAYTCLHQREVAEGSQQDLSSLDLSMLPWHWY